MAHIERDGSQVEVRHNNRQFSFLPVDTSGNVELVFVRTTFRMSDEVTGDYPTVSDIPSEVRDVLTENGYEVVSVKNSSEE